MNVRASRPTVNVAGQDQLGRSRDMTGSAAKGSTPLSCQCYTILDETIGSWRFIAAITRNAGLRPFGGAGL
jgi:hypothetical protein